MKRLIEFGFVQESIKDKKRIWLTETFKRSVLYWYDKKCANCGSTDNLEYDHIDGNPRNNKFSNIQLLCKSCHLKKTTSQRNLKKFAKN